MKGLRALRSGQELSEAGCGVRSNIKKQEVFGGPEADLGHVPPTLRGGCFTPADEAKGYAGGRLKSIKVLGAFIGERADCCRSGASYRSTIGGNGLTIGDLGSHPVSKEPSLPAC